MRARPCAQVRSRGARGPRVRGSSSARQGRPLVCARAAGPRTMNVKIACRIARRRQRAPRALSLVAEHRPGDAAPCPPQPRAVPGGRAIRDSGRRRAALPWCPRRARGSRFTRRTATGPLAPVGPRFERRALAGLPAGLAEARQRQKRRGHTLVLLVQRVLLGRDALSEGRGALEEQRQQHGRKERPIRPRLPPVGTERRSAEHEEAPPHALLSEEVGVARVPEEPARVEAALVVAIRDALRTLGPATVLVGRAVVRAAVRSGSTCAREGRQGSARVGGARAPGAEAPLPARRRTLASW